MRVYAITDAFGFDNLKITERENPKPVHDQVVIQMKACSLNFRDLLMIRGHYNPRQPLPLIPLSDGVGKVIAIGDSVKTVKVGDRVAGCFVQDWFSGQFTDEASKTTLGGPIDGMLAEQRILPEHGVIKVPEHLTDVEAAALPCACLTAWSALVEHGNVKACDTVLLLGTGGVSVSALQFSKMLGAEVIMTSSSNKKLERAKELGADHLINYKETPAWGKEVLKITSGRGVDNVVEVGGAGTLINSLKAVRRGGTVSMIGVLSGVNIDIPLTLVLMKHVRVQGILVGHREGFENMNRALSYHQIRPVIDKVFPFDRAVEAFEYMASAKHFGKVCLEF